MNKNNIRSTYVKESLKDFGNITDTLKENTTNAVRDLLDEAVRETYTKILAESEDDEYDVEEVEDTDSDAADKDVDSEVDNDTEEDGMDSDDVEGEPVETASEEGVDSDGDITGETETSGEDEDGGEWSEFEKYKVSDGEYDFSEAEDDEIVKVYKLLNNDDQVVVKKDDGKVNIKDNETGAEYIIELDGEEPVDDIQDEPENDFELELEDDNNLEDMNEARIFEIALNEYDSNVGYTDNYQKKDVMTNPGMSEPGKNVNDWDAGVPKGSDKPWSGYPSKKNKADKPFNNGKGKAIEEETGEEIEEGIRSVTQNGPNRRNVGIVQTPSVDGKGGHLGRNARKSKVPGQYRGTGEAAYGDVTTESIVRRANVIFNENAELKKALSQFKTVLKEAAVTNVNLGQIIKLISENSTTVDEKKEIIARFGKEAKTVEESKRLYESISNELKKNSTMNINEGKQYDVNGSKQINETQIYKSDDLLSTLDLMHKVCK